MSFTLKKSHAGPCYFSEFRSSSSNFGPDISNSASHTIAICRRRIPPCDAPRLVVTCKCADTLKKIYENKFFMNDEYTIIRDFPNGLRAGVERMTFGNHRIVIGYVFNWEAGYERAF